MSSFRTCLSVFLVLGICSVGDGSAQNLVGRPSSGLFGVKIGVISRMDLTSDDRYLQSEIGSCAQVYADLPRGKEFYLTTAFGFYYVGINRSSQIMIEPSIGLKRAYVRSHAGMVFEPGVSIGFAYLAETGDLRAASFLTYSLFFETHFKIDAKKAWVFELALFHAPAGSNGDVDLSFGPGIVLRGGLAFR